MGIKEEVLNELLEMKKSYDDFGFFSSLLSMKPWENIYQEGFFLYLGVFIYYLAILIFIVGLFYLTAKFLFNIFFDINSRDLRDLENNIDTLSVRLSDMNKNDYHLLNTDSKNSPYKNIKSNLKTYKYKYFFGNLIYYYKRSTVSYVLIPIGILLFLINWFFIYNDYSMGIAEKSKVVFEKYMNNPEISKSEIKRFEKLSDNEFLVIYTDKSKKIVNEIYTGSFKFSDSLDYPYYQYTDRFTVNELKDTLIYDYFFTNGEESNYSQQFSYGKSNFIIYLPNNFNINTVSSN